QEGNPHAALGVSLLGRYLASPNSVDVQPISSWYATRRPADLVAAVNGDFSYYASNGMRPSGIGVSSRQVYWYGWGGPAAGYKPGGSVVFGRPRALAAKLYFPGGAWATIGAWNALPARSDQVGVYTSAGHNVSIPSGSIAAVATGDALARLLRGTKPLRNSTGLGVAETAKGFVLDDGLTAGTVPRSLLPLAAPATGATSVAVPAGGAVLVASANGIAGQGLTPLLARAGPLSVTAPEPTWAAVTDVMGGKPQLVIRGVPVSARPDYVDTWQWTCGGGCWRTALSVTGMRRASLVVDGDVRGGGVTMPVFARMLRQLGAANAMGFDNNGSTDMFRPRPNDGSC